MFEEVKMTRQEAGLQRMVTVTEGTEVGEREHTAVLSVDSLKDWQGALRGGGMVGERGGTQI